ncbi:hypothetical protein H310_04786 [Aphanomyces invadans]|uniref:Histidine acid phosphatase n=1 Tax=Aphanomyces invadans TaxID=157072 RepID=A0A024UAH7_9STRA|nr:hypothetical protein H310_04786 [Aphanomyces invadans]ETW03279.1 hypothetical protein H310_04786 [Aphanomyces invadans]|eukprot:XP_008867508.1 hypothetical protein H310_04786 [Aphanomyces invadans]
MELVHVLAVFRHGDRSPITGTVGTNLTMSEDETQYWTTELASEATCLRLNERVRVQSSGPLAGGVWPRGHLTERGVNDMTRLGVEFRKRYAALVPRDHDPHTLIYACSTNISRTILSAKSFLSGFCGGDRLSSDNPLVLHTVEPKDLTPVLTGQEYRLRAQQLRQLALATLHGYAALEVAVKQVIGIRGAVNWASLREVLDCRHTHELPFPEGISSAMYDAITRHAAWEWYMFYSDPQGGQRGFIQAMRNFHDLLRDAILTTPQGRRFTLVCAHDNSLVALVCALQLHHSSGFVPPPYGSTLVVEIYQDKSNGTHHVNVQWDGKAMRFPQQETSLVPIEVLHAAVASFIHATTASAPSTSSM